MKLALVTTAPSIPSPTGARVRSVVPHLAARVELALFVEPGTQGGEIAEMPLRSTADLDPQVFDHIVYAVGNERSHGFMAALVRAFGGTVALDRWDLGELAIGARPELAHGGVRGSWAAWLEGGLAGALRYIEVMRAGRALPTDCALNRSVVRHADAFLVGADELRGKILAERNAPTPIALVSWDTEHPDVLAAQWMEHLALFPSHRARRKSLIKTMIEASDQARADREAQ